MSNHLRNKFKRVLAVLALVAMFAISVAPAMASGFLEQAQSPIIESVTVSPPTIAVDLVPATLTVFNGTKTFTYTVVDQDIGGIQRSSDMIARSALYASYRQCATGRDNLPADYSNQRTLSYTSGHTATARANLNGMKTAEARAGNSTMHRLVV